MLEDLRNDPYANGEIIYLAEKKLGEIEAEYLEQQAKVIQLRVNAIVDMAKNVEDYYSNINSLTASLAKYTQTSREYWIQYTSSLT